MMEFGLKGDRLLIWQRVMHDFEVAMRGLKVALSILSGSPCRASAMPGPEGTHRHMQGQKQRVFTATHDSIRTHAHTQQQIHHLEVFIL